MRIAVRFVENRSGIIPKKIEKRIRFVKPVGQFVKWKEKNITDRAIWFSGPIPRAGKN